jgi:hypothetical protein
MNGKQAKGGKPRTKLSDTFSKPNTSTKTECKAGLNAKSVESKWCVTSVCIDHNHGLSLREARYLDSTTKRKLEVNDRAGISLSSSSMDKGNKGRPETKKKTKSGCIFLFPLCLLIPIKNMCIFLNFFFMFFCNKEH